MGVFEAPGGGIVTCGMLQDGPEGPFFGIFHRLDAEGNEIWSRRSLGIHTHVEAGLLRPDDVLIVTGDKDGGLLLAALDINGDTLWTNIVRDGPTTGYCVARMADGRYALGGDAPSQVTDAAIIFFDSSGGYLCYRMYPDSVDTEFFSDPVGAILALDDGGLLFAAGVHVWPDRHSDGTWLARLDSQGDTVWTRRIRSDTAEVSLSSLVQLADGAVLYGGYAESRVTNIGQILLGKIDQSGAAVWDSLYTLPFQYYAQWQDLPLAACPDGGWVSSLSDRPGSEFDHARLLRFNASGDTLWSWSIGEEGNDMSAGEVTTLSDGGFAMAGAHWSYSPIWRIWTYVLCTEPEGSGVSDEPSVVPEQFILESVYPNPFNATATIEFTLKRSGTVRLRLYDVLGRLAMVVYEGWTPAGTHHFPLHASDLASGEYFLRGEALGSAYTERIVPVR